MMILQCKYSHCNSFWMVFRRKKIIDTVLIPTVGNFIKPHKAFKYYAKIRFSYDAADLCSCFVLSYRVLKCTETTKHMEKEKLVVFNEMPI